MVATEDYTTCATCGVLLRVAVAKWDDGESWCLPCWERMDD